MLSPVVPTTGENALDPVLQISPVEVPGTEVRVPAGVSSYVVDLWIDLVRQAASAVPTTPRPGVNGLTRQQFRALNCLRGEPMTMRALAQCLGITGSAATATADRLISAGAAQRQRDSADRRVVRVVATEAGHQMAREYHVARVAVLEQLLTHMPPARLAVLTVAMQELTIDIDLSPITSSGNTLTPDPARWTER